MHFRMNRSRLVSAATSFLVGLISLTTPDSSYALNGYTYVASCACVTSTDFIHAAMVQGQHLLRSGTYAMISSSTAETAWIQITVGRSGIGGVLVVLSAVPIDSSGNSLAGQSEATLEADFASFDLITMGTNRNQPLTVNEPTNYQISFIGSDDAEVGPGIDQALLAQGINWAFLPIGSLVTVKFNDGTKAIYFKKDNTDAHWVWAGSAWDSHGNQIYRNGQPLQNPNTSGAGGGSATVPGFGGGGGFSWSVGGGNDCTQSITVAPADEAAFNIGTIVITC